jgi:hypothetical protein
LWRRPIDLTLNDVRFLSALVCAFSLTAASSYAAAPTNYRAHVELSGQLVVSFHGDAAPGCEAAYRCDVESGTLRWTPQNEGQLYLFDSGRGRLFPSLHVFGSGGGALGTLAIVQRRAGDGTEHMCVDARGSPFESLPVSLVGKRSLRFGFRPSPRAYPAQPLFRTHCGGPLVPDFLPGLPTRTVGLRTLLRGPTDIDLSGSTEFAAGGLAGTAVSTLEVKVGQMRAQRVRRRPPRRPRPQRSRPPLRRVQVEYQVTGVSGSIPVDVLADPRACAPLDACGLAGSLTVTPRPGDGEAYLVAYGRLPKEDLRRALEAPDGPAPRGVRFYGYVVLSKEAGSVAAALERDGRPACRDAAPLRRSALQLNVRDAFVRATFGGSEPTGFDALGTRCPGPLEADLGRGRHLASGRVPLSSFSRRRLTLRLDRGTSVTTPGFELRTRPDLTIDLERESE